MQAIDTVHVDFRNEAALRRECEEARRDGFTAKMAIHPAQVAVINEVFTPTAAALAHADADRRRLRGPAGRRARSASTARCSTVRTSPSPSACIARAKARASAAAESRSLVGSGCPCLPAIPVPVGSPYTLAGSNFFSPMNVSVSVRPGVSRNGTER